MFGYITIDKPELKIKDYETFNSYYCGLCGTLKREYPPFTRFLLNYDLAFLYILADALTDSEPAYMKKRCAVHPLGKKYHTCGGEEAHFAAAMNVILAVNSIKDHAKDKKSFFYGMLARYFNRAYQKACAAYRRQAEQIEQQLNLLYGMERDHESDMDKVADAFACLLGMVFQSLPGDGRALYSLGYNLGRWIYLIDAYADYEDDMKKGSYNPFYQRFGEQAKTGQGKESASYNLYYSLKRAAEAYDLLNIKKHKRILDNIVYSGILKKTRYILDGGKVIMKHGSV